MRRKWKRVSLSIPAITCALLVCLLSAAPGSMALSAAPLRQADAKPNRIPSGGPGGVNEDARTMAEFSKRVADYESLRHTVERTLPRRDEKATPEDVVGQRRALAEGIRKSRAAAQAGDLFTPETQQLIRARLAKLFATPKVGASAKAAVNEENPRGIRVTVNAAYPDGAPLTTMPPEVLSNLPNLPEKLQYHFVGRTLILLDADARIIVDFMPNAMP